jgi:hypothetical protein
MKGVWSVASGIVPFALSAMLVVSTGCGGGSSNSSSGSTSNVQSITVNTGVATAPPTNEAYVNGAFTSVTLCAPGSSSDCQTIDGILVDTGSFGLRVLASALSVSFTQQTDSSGSPVVECFPFLDGVTWGPVQTADFTIAGEKVSSLPIQVICSSNFPNVPSGCTSYGSPNDDLASLGGNGILGVGNYAQDCGSACTETGGANPGLYYACPNSGCVVTTESLSAQVINPVASFPVDNNGVIIELPSATGAETSISGSLIFGIGTQSNNGLGSATVYTIDSSGNFTTSYGGATYTDAAFLDSGSNGIYFLDTQTTGIPTCTDHNFWYCPASTMSLTATNQGANGASGSISFTVGNADTLLSNSNDGVANGLAGPQSGMFDWGLPFFYGRNVYTAIAGASTPGGAGPYWAY